MTQENKPPEHAKPIRAPEMAPGVRLRAITPYGHMHLIVVVDLATEHELEIFAQVGKAGEMIASELEGLCRLASLYLRSGGKLQDIIKQLVGIGSTVSVRRNFNGEKDGTCSLPDSLGKVLQAYSHAKKHYGLKKMILEGLPDSPEIDVR
jgi:ribonucleoside-diphosphate reductase alpha chain